MQRNLGQETGDPYIRVMASVCLGMYTPIGKMWEYLHCQWGGGIVKVACGDLVTSIFCRIKNIKQ